MHGHLRIHGRRLEYAVWPGAAAAADAPTLLLLHEGLGSVAAWRSFPADLAARTSWRVAAYSRRGYGGSDPAPRPWPPRFMHDAALDELPQVLDALGVDRPVLFGHSDGGSIALLAAADHPDRVRALILEAPHVFVEDVTVAAIAGLREAYAAGLRDRLRRVQGDNVDAAFQGWSEVWLSAAFRDWNIEAALPRVRCPVLLFQGDRDEYGTLAQVEAIARGVGGPVHTAILPACGHAPHHHQRGPVLDQVDAFLKRLPI